MSHFSTIISICIMTFATACPYMSSGIASELLDIPVFHRQLFNRREGSFKVQGPQPPPAGPAQPRGPPPLPPPPLPPAQSILTTKPTLSPTESKLSSNPTVSPTASTVSKPISSPTIAPTTSVLPLPFCKKTNGAAPVFSSAGVCAAVSDIQKSFSTATADVRTQIFATALRLAFHDAGKD